MSDPYQPAAYATPTTPAAAGSAWRRAAIASIVASVLLAIASVVGVAVMSPAEIEQQLGDEVVRQFQGQGITPQQMRPALVGTATLIALVLLSVGVLFAAFVWRGKRWAAITLIILGGLVTLARLLGLAALAVAGDEAPASQTAAAAVATSVAATLALATAVVLLVLALRSPRPGGGGDDEEARRRAWEAYYRQQQSPTQQQPPGAGWGPPPR